MNEIRTELLPVDVAEELFTLVTDHDPRLLASCRWLLLGPRWASMVAPQDARVPGLAELTDLLRLLHRQAPRLLPLGRELIRTSHLAEAAILDLMVDRLLEHSDWSYPTQVLPRPRPDFSKLLEACQARLESATGERRRLEEVIVKVERAVRITDAARKRRQQLRRGAG